MQQKLIPVATSQNFAPGTWTDSWKHMGGALENPMGVGWFGMTMGLGFVLSFGYWCTDFLVVQRAMAANSMSAARRTPLIAAIPKMLFPALVILPGMIAIALHYSSGNQFLPIGKDGTPDYNMTIPTMLAKYFPTGLLGLGFTALMASFMSGMAGNVTAFNTVWTYDIYQSYIAPKKSDNHYLWMGRWATVFGILVSIGCAYLASKFNNIMDMLQLVFGFVNAPLFATFMLGMFWRRSTGHGAFWGLLGGTAFAVLFHGLARPEAAGPIATWADAIKGGWIAVKISLPQRDGPELLDGDCGVDLLLCPDSRNLPRHEADQDQRRTQGPSLFADTQAGNGPRTVVYAANDRRHPGAAGDPYPEHHFLVTNSRSAITYYLSS